MHKYYTYPHNVYATFCKRHVLLLVFCFGLSNTFPLYAQDLVKYVQPLSGTAPSTTAASLKHGGGSELNANTIPSVTLPFAMTQWTPQTRTTEKKCLPPYFYNDSMLTGFRGTHWLSGSCVQDYGSVTLMPITGGLITQSKQYATRFYHKNEEATPHYYKVEMPEYQITTQLTATPRCGLLQFTVNRNDSFYLLITPNSDYGEANIVVDKKRGEIRGYNPVHRIYQGWGKAAGFSGYFVIKIDRAIGAMGTYSGDAVFDTDSISNRQDIGAFIGFLVKKGERIRVRVGTSFSSLEGARKNLTSELPGYDFDAVALKAKATWQKALEQVAVATKNETDKRIFYTALYHSMQHPRLYNDVDGTYPTFAAGKPLRKITGGNYYDDMSMWDIYRAQLPLQEILRPTLMNDVVQSLILKGQQGGWMPIFPCWNSYTAAMIGDHAAPVIASAYLKGIRNYNVAEGYRLLRQNALTSPANRQDYIDGKGRRALESYKIYGYIPMEDSVQDAFHKKEQVSRTLEYAYDDYAVARLANALGKKADDSLLMKRAANYKNVYDPSVKMMRGRYANRKFVQQFNPDGKEPFITEGTPRQYSLYVPHDVTGLANLMGGKDALEAALDSLFVKNEYWHGNEPGHQIPFMYNFTNAPWKTQEKVTMIRQEEYSDGPGGLSGNDDAGQMSAWYVFAAMGFYPVNTVDGTYQLCAPLFDEVSIKVAPAKTFKIVTKKTGPAARYISSATLNGKAYAAGYLQYADIMRGGVFEIVLSDTPSATWGISK